MSIKLFIKYMVSLRCKLIVKEELQRLGLHYVIVNLGRVEILAEITREQRNQLKENLLKSRLELLEDKEILMGKSRMPSFPR
ncbi:hypothetical protein FNH22_27905 [Fulvivirga sp. M361]|uniref:hypothetical protein n=1 Tax=Fulvivirga sp. M361 TaxID=2594266 RepID=UPI00117B43DF|nr:hypothetical protein [Fulvivirga sp. M361]TRX49061.1 hypothetical protein FNH22_27905 [Fulvivirga sp. M361]